MFSFFAVCVYCTPKPADNPAKFPSALHYYANLHKKAAAQKSVQPLAPYSPNASALTAAAISMTAPTRAAIP